MKRYNLKVVIISTLISITFFSFFIFFIEKIQNINSTKQEASVLPIIENTIENIPLVENKHTTLFFVGDIMMTRGVKSSVIKNFNNDYSKLFENLPELKNADILLGNLEGDVSDKGNNVGSKYSFRMDPAILPVLKNAGFNILSFANNHVGDWNKDAFLDTLSKLDETGILKTGAGQNSEEAESPTIIEKNNTKFGFLSFSDVGPSWMEAKSDSPGILLASNPKISGIIKNAKLSTDVLIVSFHFGDEYKVTHNKRQETLAHMAIDSGADMVIGHHPHVIEDIEEYNGKPIIYSLGNFIFDQSFSKDTMRGMLFSATFDGSNLIESNKKIITLNNHFQPEGIFNESDVVNNDNEKNKIAIFECPKPSKNYIDMSLLNVGQEVKLSDETYIPKNLEALNSSLSTKKGLCLTKEARDAFETLNKKAKTEGLSIKVSSAFRSYETQKNIFNTAANSGKIDTLTSIAKPGYSEHQTGTAADITGLSINYESATSNFDNSPEDNWLKQNAYLYGFIQSYPSGKENITGYKYEPWHYRYVGIEKAKEIILNNQTITEYLALN